MTNKRIYFGLLAANVIVFFFAIFSDFKWIVSVIGIALLLLTFLCGRRINSDPSKYKRVVLGSNAIEFVGIEAIVFGILGFYLMVKLTDQIDVTWLYYLLFNVFILSQARIRIYKDPKC